MLFLDLAKAFDSIDHEILLQKLQFLGFRRGCTSWFKSYLCHRSQSTLVGSTLSGQLPIQCGVPQGSILGPLLFLCYINDLPCHLRQCKSFMYADDTAILKGGKNCRDIALALNSDLVILSKWFSANKLCLNAGKTKSMLFYNGRKFTNDNSLLIMHGVQEIEQVDHFRYLGIELDSNLTFQHHIEYIRKKVQQRTRLLWKMRSYITKELALSLYNSLIEPIFLYCNTIYDGINLTNRRKLQVYQNSALRAVARVNKRYSATQLHQELSVEWLDVQRCKSVCNEVYKYTNGHGPLSLVTEFEPQIPRRELRSNTRIIHKHTRTRTKFAENDPVIRGKKYWDRLPASIQTSENQHIFKSRLKLDHHVFEHIT